MKRAEGELEQRRYDIVVVGGGMFGACVAWDAACRGLSVAMVEKSDFGSQTSANHFRVAHGGIRYLQHLDLTRVRESMRERAALIRVAPHLVYPLPIVMPTYGHGVQGKAVLRAGFAVYDLITADRNSGIADPDRRIPGSSVVDRDRVREEFSSLEDGGLTGGGVFYDGQIFDSSRLVLSFIRGAASRGADVANYLEVERFLRNGDRITGVAARDCLTGTRRTIEARMVVNATGPWAVKLLRDALGLDPGGRAPTFSRDVALVTRSRISKEYGLACPIGTGDADALVDRGGRHLFFVPWRGYTLVGVWHGVDDCPPSDVTVSRDELEEYIAEANEAYPGLDLSVDDVAFVNTGLVLFGGGEQGEDEHSFGKRSLVIDHAEDDAIDGLVTLVGVRATMGRRLAEQVVDLVGRKLGFDLPPSRTDERPIYGGDFHSFDELLTEINSHSLIGGRSRIAKTLAHQHGSEYRQVLEYAARDDGLARRVGEEAPTLDAEIRHAVDREAARRLLDVVHRRTALGYSTGLQGNGLERTADILADLLGWEPERRRRELDEVRTYYQRLGGLDTSLPRSGAAPEPVPAGS